MLGFISRRRLLIPAGTLLVILLAAFLLIFPKSKPPAFDYLTEKARQLNFNADQIVSFVRDQIASNNSYPGALRGAVGTLWAGEGSDLDRALLLQALLEKAGLQTRFVHGATYGVEIDQGQGKFRYAGPARNADAVALSVVAPPDQEFHSLTLFLKTLAKDASEVTSEDVTFRTADLAGRDITIFYRQYGSKTVTVVSFDGKEIVSTVDAASAVRQELIFKATSPDGRVVERRRELFTREFSDYPSFFDPINRYSVVVTTGWVPTWVDQREEAEAGSEAAKSPADARNHIIAFRFLAQSDAHTKALMDAKQLRANLVSPRITIVADEPMDQGTKGARAVSIDLRKNDLAFDGEERRKAAFATARSIYDSALESEVLRAVTGMASYSAATALANAQQPARSSIEQRQWLFRSLLMRLLAAGHEGASLRIGPADKDDYSVTFETAKSALVVKPSATVGKALAEARPPDRWLLDHPNVVAEQIGEAAAELEVALALAANLPADYRPGFRYSAAGADAWYVNSRAFTYNEGKVAYEGELESLDPDIVVDAISYYDWKNNRWFDTPLHQQVTIRHEDFLHAHTYSTWFGGGLSENGRTYNMLSQDAYRELKRDGRTVLKFRFSDGSESEPMLLWAFPGRLTITLNNRELSLNVLLVNGDYEKNHAGKPDNPGAGPTLDDRDSGGTINQFAILDDERYPVMIDDDMRVQSELPGQLVDAVTKSGIDSATVTVGDVSAKSWPDGSFSLPIFQRPFDVFDVKVEAPGYAAATLSIDFRSADSLPLKLELKPLSTSVPAPPVWIDNGNVSTALAGLTLGEHSKRLISDGIKANPALGMLVPRQDIWGPDGKIDAWLEVNTSSYDVYGMMSDGLYGSTTRLLGICARSVGTNAARTYVMSGTPNPTVLPNCGISYFSGRIAAWYLFAAGAVDSVGKAIESGRSSMDEIYKNAVVTARVLAAICYDWTDSAVGIGGSLVIYNNRAFKLGLADGQVWAEEFYAKAWGVAPQPAR